jgi:hypothetical protein
MVFLLHLPNGYGLWIVIIVPFPYMVTLLLPQSYATLASLNHGLPNNME